MTMWKGSKEFRRQLKGPVFFFCQPETFLAAGGAGVSRQMDMMAQFMPRPGTKYSDLHLIFCYSFSIVNLSSIRYFSLLICPPL